MKKKLKNYLKIGIFLFGIFVIINGCSEDNLTIPVEESGKTRVNKISWKKFANNLGISKNDDINKFYTINNKSSLKGNDDTPTILTDEILMIEKEDATHYTFKLDKSGENGEFYNLAIIVDNNQEIVESKVFEYIPDDNWLFDTTQPFTGFVKIINGIFTLEEMQNVLSKGSSQKTFESCVDSVNSYWECGLGTTGHYEGHPRCGANSWDYIIDIEWEP